MINFLLKIPLQRKQVEIEDLFLEKPSSLTRLEDEYCVLLTWGDAIIPNQFMSALSPCAKPQTILENVAGHFYYLLHDKRTDKLWVGNSLFGILPVYYAQFDGMVWIANHVDAFKDKISLTYNKRFILENILFNYPLFDISCYKEVDLLSVNSALFLTPDKFQIMQCYSIENLFVQKPIPKKQSLKLIVDAFLKTVEKYYPDYYFSAALTGGFDGRTLVSKALFSKCNFRTYCFGSDDSLDLRVARNLSQKAGIPLLELNLDNAYVKKESCLCGVEFIKRSCGTAGFSRAHYLYAAKVLSEETDVLITGNFGSEVFRAFHIAGAVLSDNLYNLFCANDYSNAIKKIENAPEWKWLNKDAYDEEKKELYREIKELPMFNQNFSGFTKSQQLYKVVFDIVFRKYFGAEMHAQFQLLKNRTPFLDIDFLKVLMTSEYAGVYSDFFTHNPVKRFKGQVVYANVIKQTYPLFLSLMTDKGYKPADILSFKGKIKIIFAFIKKKIVNVKQRITDPFAVKKSFNYNVSYWKKISIDTDVFNEKAFEDNPDGSNNYHIALSQVWWYNNKKTNVSV